MRYGVAAWAATLWAFVGFPALAAPSDVLVAHTAESSSALVIPQLRLRNTIRLSVLGLRGYTMSIAFSPDGRYLAIEDEVSTGITHIIVWDLLKNKEQARITGLQQPFDVYPNVVLSWTPDGKYITFGMGGRVHPLQFWDPMTGQLVKEVADVMAYSLRFNRDGTKALASPGQGDGSKVRIYDTAKWTYQDFDQGQLFVQATCWAADGQVLAVGYWRIKQGAEGDKDGRSPDQGAFKSRDEVARLFDPSGRLPDRTRLLIPSVQKTVKSSGKDITYYQNELNAGPFLVTDNTGEVIALDIGHLVNGRTLEMLTYATMDDVLSHNVPAVLFRSDLAVSPDGNLLYLKGNAPYGKDDSAQNLILNARTGKPLLRFQGGHAGIAISPSGKQLAIGNGSSVKVFDVQ